MYRHSQENILDANYSSIPGAKFTFQINWALQHMIKIHNCDEGPSSLLKISLSEKEKNNKKTKKLPRSPVSGEK
jgi:hypothetical protein